MEAERGNLDRARELFQQGVWADPNSRNTLYVFHAWAVLEKRAGNAGLARELFKAAIKVCWSLEEGVCVAKRGNGWGRLCVLPTGRKGLRRSCFNEKKRVEEAVCVSKGRMRWRCL